MQMLLVQLHAHQMLPYATNAQYFAIEASSLFMARAHLHTGHMVNILSNASMK